MAGFGADMQLVANDLIGLFGSGRNAQLINLNMVRDTATGKTQTVESEPIAAIYVELERGVKERDGAQWIEAECILSGSQIGNANLLSGEWLIQLEPQPGAGFEGVERWRIREPVSTNPDGSAVIWECKVIEGSANGRA